MTQPNSSTEPVPQPLPLFRPEALAAQQHKLYGEILLIRPFSLTLFFWLGIGISAVVMGFLLLGSYTERAHVTGTAMAAGADLYVPERTIKFVRMGEPILVHCQSCPGQEQGRTQMTGNIDEISKSILSQEQIAAESRTTVQEPMYRIKLTLPQTGAQSFPEGARLEADLPLGRRPLLQWLFERGN